MAEIQSYIVQNPSTVFYSTTTLLGLAALSPAPSFAPIALLVAALHLHAYILVPRRQILTHGTIQTLLLAGAASLAHIGPSLAALSSSGVAFVSLGCVSFVSSAIALLSIFLSYKLSHHAHSTWISAVLFPTVWASVWGVVAHISPVGRLVTWSPVVGLGPYEWLRPILGQFAIDWVVAAWAGVAAAAAGSWLMGPQDEYDVLDTDPLVGVPGAYSNGNGHIAKDTRSQRQPHPFLLTAGVLLLLTVPSFLLSTLPLPVNAPYVTPLGVSCVLPYPHRSGHRTHPPTLDDYIAETRTMQGRASIILWPEAAVRFDTVQQKEEAFSRVQKTLDGRKYVGVSFEDYTPASNGDRGAPGTRRNGLALIQKDGPPVFEYYKRHLVPIAESFSLTPSIAPPSMDAIELDPPKLHWNKTEWAPGTLPGGNYTRPVPLTASICLDFSSASTFAELDTRPALILAPARTWHPAVGAVMYAQARARAEELGSTLLWCDGGEGGLSGVAGGGMGDGLQLGAGSWARAIGVQWPFDQKRTVFARIGGDWAALVTVWTVLAVGWGSEAVLVVVISRLAGRGPSLNAIGVHVHGALLSARELLSRRLGRHTSDDERPLLIDA